MRISADNMISGTSYHTYKENNNKFSNDSDILMPIATVTATRSSNHNHY